MGDLAVGAERQRATREKYGRLKVVAGYMQCTGCSTYSSLRVVERKASCELRVLICVLQSESRPGQWY